MVNCFTVAPAFLIPVDLQNMNVPSKTPVKGESTLQIAYTRAVLVGDCFGQVVVQFRSARHARKDHKTVNIQG